MIGVEVVNDTENIFDCIFLNMHNQEIIYNSTKGQFKSIVLGDFLERVVGAKIEDSENGDKR